MVTNPVHRAQALPADLWFKIIQHLIDRIRNSECLSVFNAGTYLVYYIDKCLGIVPRQTSNYLNLIIVREDCSDQRDSLVYPKARCDESFPGGKV